MSDLISRQAAIDVFKNLIGVDCIFEEDPKVVGALIAVKEAITQLPSAEDEWIPVSERLPEKTGKYLVTVKNGNVYAGTFDQYSRNFQCAAIAWMPLPEPYQEEKK